VKQCSYCGRENPDDAKSCRECGTQGFVTLALPPEAWPQRGRKPSGVLFRVLAATIVGVSVAGLSLFAAWRQGGDASAASLEQWHTRYDLRHLNECLTQYQQQFHRSPSSLAQLLAMTSGTPPAEDYPWLRDGWKRPFLFSTDGTNCLITSLGRDGKPGGRGLDWDLTNRHGWPNEAFPTFHQFFFEMPKVRGMIASCFVCGGLAFLLCFRTAKMPELTWPGLTLLGFRLLLTIIGAVVVAIVITALHVPSGH
jgi:hypothetical protein